MSFRDLQVSVTVDPSSLIGQNIFIFICTLGCFHVYTEVTSLSLTTGKMGLGQMDIN